MKKVGFKQSIIMLILIALIINIFSIVLLNVTISTNVEEPKSTNSNILYSTDFEDGDYSKFLSRGSTTELSISQTSYSGNYSLLISNRTEDWSGVQIDIDSFGAPGVEYLISAKVKSTAEKIDLSYKYRNTDGNMKYVTLGSYSGDRWLTIEDVKFTFYENMSEVYLYFAGTPTDIYIDDFKIEIATIEQNIPSLKETYSNLFNVGVGVDNSEFKSSPIKLLILKHFDTIAVANELKPEYVLDKEATLATGVNDNPQVDISSAKDILDFCERNNISVRGHTITWYDQTPTWFFKENYDENANWVDEETMKKRLENYIKNLFAAIKSEHPNIKFSAWDVVNEAWLDNGSYRSHCSTKVEEKVNGLMCSPWTTIFGDNSYIEYAFTYARKYAPKDTKLYYADFGNYKSAKRQSIYNMALELKEKRLIDGIAMHSHLEYNFTTEEEYKEYLNQYDQTFELYKKTGLDIQISELDIAVPNKDYELQAKFYSDYLDIIVKHYKSISYLGFWGLTDDNSWKKAYTPTLFYRDYSAKPCFYSIIDGDLSGEEEKEETKVKSTDNTLKTISIDNALIKDFSSNKLSYDLVIDKEKISVKAVANDTKASISGIGSYNLKYGKTTIKIIVTSEAGTKKTYVLNITRNDNRSSVNTLSNLTISSGNIDFKSNINEYNVEVESDIDKITITSTLTDKKSSYVEDYKNKTINLAYGLNTISIKIKAENGSINTYKLNITRKEKDKFLDNKIAIKDYDINFSSTNYDYFLKLTENTKELDFIIELADEKYTYSIEGNNDLENGSIVKVIIKDETTNSREYTFNIIKDIKEENNDEEVKENDENNNIDIDEKTNKDYLPIIVIFSVIIVLATIFIIHKYRTKKNIQE